MLNQRFFSHSEEDIRISQSEAFSSGGPIREKIDKRTFTLVWTLGFLGRLIGRLRYEVRFCTIRDDTDLLESFFETGMHGPEIVFEQSDSVRISQGRGSLVCKVLHNKRELLKVFVFRSVCRFCVGGAVFTDDSSFSYSYKSYRSTVFWRRASLRTRSDDYFVFITQLIYSRIFSFFWDTSRWRIYCEKVLIGWPIRLPTVPNFYMRIHTARRTMCTCSVYI